MTYLLLKLACSGDLRNASPEIKFYDRAETRRGYPALWMHGLNLALNSAWTSIVRRTLLARDQKAHQNYEHTNHVAKS